MWKLRVLESQISSPTGNEQNSSEHKTIEATKYMEEHLQVCISHRAIAESTRVKHLDKSTSFLGGRGELKPLAQGFCRNLM
jgi:hypothetical protein